MNRKEIGEYFYRYYAKRSSSFMANIYKASITADSKDIHRARLDVKKIFAFFTLIEIVAPDTVGRPGHFRLFRSLYRQAGKIREIQVNFLLLDHPELAQFNTDGLDGWLRERENQAVKRFVHQVKKFDETALQKIENELAEICLHGKISRLRSRTEVYLRSRAEAIREIQEGNPGEKEIHRIRQNLKAMATIATLVYTVRSEKRLDDIIVALNRVEIMIGDWHDRVVLHQSIRKYMNSGFPGTEKEGERLAGMLSLLEDKIRNLTQHFLPEVVKITELILAAEESADPTEAIPS